MSEALSSDSDSKVGSAPVPQKDLFAATVGHTDDESIDIVLALSRSDRRFLAVSGGIILLLMGVYLVQSRRHQPDGLRIVRAPENELALRLDINTATWVEWMQMEGIGEALARTIVADRETRGPFRSVDDVSRVRGIGDAKLSKIRPYLQCLDCPSPAASPEPTSP